MLTLGIKYNIVLKVVDKITVSRKILHCLLSQVSIPDLPFYFCPCIYFIFAIHVGP